MAKLKKPKKVVIDRNTWLRGCKSMLCDDDGCKCVLGFVFESYGVPTHCMRNAEYPTEVKEIMSDWNSIPDFFFDGPDRVDLTEVADRMIFVNDSSSRTDEEREAQLKELTASIGIELEFKG